MKEIIKGNITQKRIKLTLYQDAFYFSESRYPALISAIGTGKTFILLLKIMNFCRMYANSLALVVRKEYTDLKDSTCRDFERYFNCVIPNSKDYILSNKSRIMFRHGAELNVLKNINLSIFGIEQAEEFETDETFDFLRDRLRRDNSPLRQGCVIANANGHNWLWKRWINNNPDPSRYFLQQANTFDNAHNLPADFIEDLKTMKEEAPNHYKRFVENSHEEVDEGDVLYPYQLIKKSTELQFKDLHQGINLMGVDVSRFGNDRSCFIIIRKCVEGWKQIYLKTYTHLDTMSLTGRLVDLVRTYSPKHVYIDDIGVGGGVYDRAVEVLDKHKVSVLPYRANEKPVNDMYVYKKDEDFFRVFDLLKNEELQLMKNEEQEEDLQLIRYDFKSNGKKHVLGKDVLRKQGIRSPDIADTLSMCCALIPLVPIYDRTKNVFVDGYKTVTPATERIIIRGGY